jgi:hypothetical protein
VGLDGFLGEMKLARGQRSIASAVGPAVRALGRGGIIFRGKRRYVEIAVQDLADGGQQLMLAGGFGDVAQCPAGQRQASKSSRP